MALVFRTLNYADIAEVRAYITKLHRISEELAEQISTAASAPTSAERDTYHFECTAEFIDRCVIKARREENEANTFAGLALERSEVVAVHLLRRFEEGPRIGAQVAGSWVCERHRRQGVARRLKSMGEAWARKIGAEFLSTNVLVNNHAMLTLNRSLGYVDYRINMRKRL